LLVVIAIIAILAAILFPVFAQARESARQSSCLSNTKQVGLGILQYVQDYDEKFPIWCYYINGDPNIWSGMFGNTAPYGGADKPWGPWKNRHVGWDKAVQPYIKNTQIFHCPSQGDGADTSAAQSGHGDDDQGPTGAVNYALNGHISKRDQNGDNTLAQIRFPAVFVLLAESSKGSSTGETTSEVNWMEWGWNGGHVHQLNGDGSADSGWDGNDAGGYRSKVDAMCHQGTHVQWGQPDRLRAHKGGANYGFGDGHSKWYAGDASCVIWDRTGTIPRNESGGTMTYLP